MTRGANPKLPRQSPVADAVSHPLFDALHLGCLSIGQQKANLITARDLVQTLHAQLDNTDSKASSEKHERYIECAIRAWRVALDTYTDIFENLIKVTTANADEGRPAASSHDAFKRMAETASAAKIAAAKYEFAGENAETDGKPKPTHSRLATSKDEHIGSGETDRVASKAPKNSTNKSDPQQSKDFTPPSPQLLAILRKRPLPSDEQSPDKTEQPPSKVQNLGNNFNDDKVGRNVLWDRFATKPNVPFAIVGASEKRRRQAKKQTREENAAKRAAKSFGLLGAGAKDAVSNKKLLEPGRRTNVYEDNSKSEIDRDHISLNDGGGVVEPRSKVQYEDVTAEVEARMKAKEEEKKARKKMKKRKRESDGSMLGGTSTNPPKPKKKRAKSDANEPGAAQDAVPANVEKRKNDAAFAKDGGAELHKKRKIQD